MSTIELNHHGFTMPSAKGSGIEHVTSNGVVLQCNIIRSMAHNLLFYLGSSVRAGWNAIYLFHYWGVAFCPSPQME